MPALDFAAVRQNRGRMRRAGIRAAAAGIATTVALALPAAAQAINFEPFVVVNGALDATDVTWGDFDQDGDADLAVIEDGGEGVQVLLGGPGQSFGAPAEYSAGPTASGGRAVQVADFNNDGDPDIAKTTTGSDNVAVFYGDNAPGGDPPGGGEFEAGTPYDTSTGFGAGMDIGDFDGDSDLDIAVSDSATAEVDILVNNGAAFVAAGASVPVAVASNDVTVADFNADGEPDVASAGSGQNVSVALGGAGTTFSAAVDYVAGNLHSDIDAAHLDGDFDPELIVANADGSISILTAGAGGTFGPVQDLPVSSGAYDVQAFDFDVDGDQDVAVSDPGDGSVSVLPREGVSFGSPQRFSVGDTAPPLALAVGPFGGDARPDLVTAAFTPSGVRMLIGAPDPDPEYKSKVVVGPVSGSVYYTCPDSAPRTLLRRERELSLNCIIYAEAGRVRLTSADVAGNEQTAEFYEGDFTMQQFVERPRRKLKNGKVRKGRPETITQLTLYRAKPKCGGKASASGPVAQAAAGRRGLWGSGRGRFRTRGSRSSGTVRGTTWFVGETCAGTLTRVTDGVVEVRDFVRNRTVILRKGDSYLARNPGKRANRKRKP
jgi:hypothetical protein